MTLPDVDATTAVQMVHDREISVTELVEAAISKIEMNDPKPQRGRRQGFRPGKGGRQDRGKPANVRR